MVHELVRTGIAGLSDKDEAAMLASLLSLTSDAVLVFNKDGVVVLANEEAERLFRSSGAGLVGSDVRSLFPPVVADAMSEKPLIGSLPFALDGTSSVLVCEASDHAHVRVRVRCERLAIASEACLLCAHALVDETGEYKDEHDRLVEELSRANRRLSGTLGIVLGTLDSLDVGTLFSRILGEITETMDAWASLVYMAEQDGYRLRGTTDSIGDAPVPAFFAYDNPLAELTVEQGHSICVSVRPLTRDELRKGSVTQRELVEEETGVSMVVSADLIPPCPSFVMVPVWFGGHMIALIVVGWRHVYRLRRDDLRLLDSVAEYLSVQLAGAFATLRAQHAENVKSLGSELRERLLATRDLDAEVIDAVFVEAAQGVNGIPVVLKSNYHQRTTTGEFSVLGWHYVPLDLSGICRTNEMPVIRAIDEFDGLTTWLAQSGELSRGLLVALGTIDEFDHGYLILRDANDEPFGEVDVEFFERLAEDVLEILAGERARTQDKRISQALQRGMQNELQQVDGLSTQSRYQSATEEAYVGGDFYDLIRLPERHACVIMGDVSGKGVEAASVSAAVKTALGAYAWEGLSPARMVSLLNDFLLGFSRIETFATLFLGIVDLESSTLTYCSAGHPPALMVRAETGELTLLGVQSGVVGAFEGLSYRNGEVSVDPGDILLLYTDGVTEARNPDGAFFGEDGLRDAVAREAALGFEGLCDRVLDDVTSFAGGTLGDDVALVVLRFDGVGPRSDL